MSEIDAGIDDLKYLATMTALQAERAYLQVELAEMEPHRQALLDRIDQIDQALTTGVPIEAHVRMPGRWSVGDTPSIPPPEVPSKGPVTSEGPRTSPSVRRGPRTSGPPPVRITPQSEQVGSNTMTQTAVQDPALFGMGMGPNGEQPPAAPRADPDDAAFLQRMQQVAQGGDDDWLDDPRYAPGPEHVDPYKRQMGE